MQKTFVFDDELSAWVASDPACVSEAFHHPQLRVRPPAERVPRALQGTATGVVFALLVRMNDGDFHRAHRLQVAASAQRWSRGQVREAGRLAAADLLPRVGPNDLLATLPVQAMARLK